MFSLKTHRRLKEYGFENGMTLIQIIDAAVIEWLDKRDPKRANR